MAEEIRETWRREPTESWFGSRARESIPVRVPRPGLTALVGAVVGALASVPSLESARVLADRLELGAEPFATRGAFIVASVTGAVLGAVLCLTMMHAMRWIGRFIFASIMTPALGFCIHVQLVTHHVRGLPLVPLLVGACLFGACVACVPQIGSRRFKLRY